MSRRRLFGVASLAGAAGVAAGVGGALVADRGGSASAADRVIPFYGPHQAGILAPNAGHGWFAAFDLSSGVTAAQLTGLLRDWTSLARMLTRGETPPGDDTIALGVGPSSLTVTVGFGPSLLRRFKVPVPVAEIPPFPRDELDPARSGGDIGVLVTADDALVVAHALRMLTRSAAGAAKVRWQMSGFSEAGPHTPRNLMGQLDGTGNPRPTDPGFASKIFVSGSPGWMKGGSYLVFRRIRMLLDDWDQLSRSRQEQIVGRRKDTGAPLSGGTEFTPFDLDLQRADGGLAIGPSAHVRQAAAQTNEGAIILRKGFSYFDGYRSDGTPDAGLLFTAFQADPANGFTRIQQRLALADDLSRLLRHSSSALFAVPGGVRAGGYLGQDLMESI